MKQVIAYGDVKDGVIKIHRRKEFDEAMKIFEGKTFRLLASRNTRSLSQNGLYWCWNTIIGKQLGWSKEDVHEWNKAQFNSHHITFVDKKTGEVTDKEISGSTTDLSIDGMTEFMEQVQRFWSEQGIDLSSINEQNFYDYEHEGDE